MAEPETFVVIELNSKVTLVWRLHINDTHCSTISCLRVTIDLNDTQLFATTPLSNPSEYDLYVMPDFTSNTNGTNTLDVILHLNVTQSVIDNISNRNAYIVCEVAILGPSTEMVRSNETYLVERGGIATTTTDPPSTTSELISTTTDQSTSQAVNSGTTTSMLDCGAVKPFYIMHLVCLVLLSFF